MSAFIIIIIKSYAISQTHHSQFTMCLEPPSLIARLNFSSFASNTILRQPTRNDKRNYYLSFFWVINVQNNENQHFSDISLHWAQSIGLAIDVKRGFSFHFFIMLFFERNPFEMITVICSYVHRLPCICRYKMYIYISKYPCKLSHTQQHTYSPCA